MEHEAAFYRITLEGVSVQTPRQSSSQLRLAAPTNLTLRSDGIYLSSISKIVVGCFMFGPAPESRFMHQTTNPLHSYSRPYTVEGALVQWSLGGLANEEQHAVLAAGGSSLLADHVYCFVPFAPPVYGAAYRILSKKDEDCLNPDIVDSLGDDNYKRTKFVLGGRQVILGEVIFHDEVLSLLSSAVLCVVSFCIGASALC